MEELITLETPVEDIVSRYPQAIEYGIMNRVSFVYCVGSFPMTLGDLLKIRKVEDPQGFVDGLNEYLRTNSSPGE